MEVEEAAVPEAFVNRNAAERLLAATAREIISARKQGRGRDPLPACGAMSGPALNPHRGLRARDQPEGATFRRWDRAGPSRSGSACDELTAQTG